MANYINRGGVTAVAAEGERRAENAEIKRQIGDWDHISSFFLLIRRWRWDILPAQDAASFAAIATRQSKRNWIIIIWMADALSDAEEKWDTNRTWSEVVNVFVNERPPSIQIRYRNDIRDLYGGPWGINLLATPLYATRFTACAKAHLRPTGEKAQCTRMLAEWSEPS